MFVTMLRAKAGGRQSTKDNSGKTIKSAGAALRRYNEAALVRGVREVNLPPADVTSGRVSPKSSACYASEVPRKWLRVVACSLELMANASASQDTFCMIQTQQTRTSMRICTRQAGHCDPPFGLALALLGPERCLAQSARLGWVVVVVNHSA